MNFKEELSRRSAEVEEYLVSCLESVPMPEGLRAAMNYSLLAGGKRLRPVLCLCGAELFGLCGRAILPFAAGVECIHSYSLVHDDLPAMDDDDLRRGKPSNHKAFGEATAILAGDGLLTDAFALMSSVGLNGAVPAGRALEAVNLVAVAAGSSGMVGGQYLDMRYTAGADKKLSDLQAMQAAKTGALIRASCESGAVLAGADPDGRGRMAEYGLALGAAFQIVDDILDEVGDEAVLGKPVGSDAAQGKVTYPALVGVKKSRELAEAQGDGALAALACFAGPAAEFLRGLVGYVLKRAR